jgi:hypothetical protein
MKPTTFSKAVVNAAWILIPCFALAQQDQLSLKHGTYVVEGSSCKEPALAVMMSWDGAGFSGPHASNCVSRVLSHHGNQFSVSTTCSALGDGTENPSGRAYVETLSLTRLSNTRIVISNETKPKATYRWCSAETTANP